MKRDTNLDSLISLIYDTAIDPEKWPDLLEALSQFIHQSGSNITSNGESDEATLIPAPEGGASIAEALLHLSASGSLVAVDGRAIRNEQEEVNRILLGHFSKALQIAKSLLNAEERQETLHSVLDQLPIALLVVDADGRLLQDNHQARHLLDESPLLTLRDGQLRATTRVLHSRLKEMIARVADSPSHLETSEHLLLQHPNIDSLGLMLILSPAKSGSLDNRQHVSIFIASRESLAHTLPESLRQIYGLTEMEFRVCGLLAQGYSVKEVAQTNRSTEHTVRAQLRSIFSKTDTARQAELVAKLLGGAAVQAYGVQGGLRRKNLPDTPHLLQLHCGRQLSYQEYGDPYGLPVIFCHSTVGSRLELAFNGAQEAAARGIRLIIPDRPGRGLSTPHLDGTLLQWTDDLAELLEHLEVEQFYVVGYAMGGMYADAVAFIMSERVKQLVLISNGVSPQTSEDFRDMQPLFSMIQRLARDFPKIHRFVTAIASKNITNTPRQLLERLGAKCCDSDKKILYRADFFERFASNITEAYHLGGNHTAQETEIAMRPGSWGFAPSDITVPVQLWHGELDNSLPLILAEKFQRQAPSAKLHVVPGMGHYMFYEKWPEILDGITAHYRRQAGD